MERQYRLPSFSVKAALRRPHRDAEQAIADALGTRPLLLWPSRYDEQGERRSPQPTRNYASARGAG